MAFAIANVLAAMLFVFAAGLQYNDPDALVWVLGYVVATILCIGALSGRLPWRVPAIYAVFTALWGLVHWFTGTGMDVGMEMGPKAYGLDDEVVREVMGLWIVAAWMSVLAWRARAAPAPG
jgi:hypothetical protein